MQDPITYRHRQNPAENKAAWMPLDEVVTYHEGKFDLGKCQALAALWAGDKIAGALDMESYVVQQLWHYALDPASIEKAPGLRHPAWEAWRCQEIADLLFAAYSEGEDESADVLLFAEGRIARLSRWYELKDRTAVEDFLRENPFLLDLLEDAHGKIQEYFDPDISLALKVVREPDVKNSRRLFILIYTTLRPKEAITSLDELDREWWLDALSAARGKLSIDIEYG